MRKELLPDKSIFNIVVFAILVFVTLTGVPRGGFQVIKVTLLPIILSCFVVFGKKNKVILEDGKITFIRQFLGIFYFRPVEIQLSDIIRHEVWSIMGAKRLTLYSGTQEVMTFKAGELGQSQFDEIVEYISKKL